MAKKKIAVSDVSEVMSNVKAHFSEKVRSEIHIEEWDVTLYSDPITIKKFDVIDKIRKSYPTAEALIRTLVIVAKDEAGDYVFTKADIPQLLRASDLKVVANAVTILTSDSDNSVDDYEKN